MTMCRSKLAVRNNIGHSGIDMVFERFRMIGGLLYWEVCILDRKLQDRQDRNAEQLITEQFVFHSVRTSAWKNRTADT